MPKQSLVESFPALKTLTLRQLELLHLKGIHVPDAEFKVIDLSQNLDFATPSTDKMPCVTPDGQKFLSQQVRFVSGVESLHYMGIYYDETKLKKYPNAFLQDLAGNAFETSSCAANFFCNMLFLARNFMCRAERNSIRSSPRPLISIEGCWDGFGPDLDSDIDL